LRTQSRAVNLGCQNLPAYPIVSRTNKPISD
jgi:hypothetical protein